MSVPIICDSGTGYLKIGWANQNFPQHSIPAIIGRPLLRFGEKIGNIELKDVMVGDEAAPLRSFLELSYPVEEGIVNNWEDMCRLWDRGFDKMGIIPKESAIMMTEPVLNPVKNREKMTEVLFEKYGFDRMQIGIQALLSLFAEGLMTSTLVDSGDGVTHCIPVVEGFILKHLISRMNIAGRHVTNYLVKLLFLKGYAFNSSADFEIVREIKERSCFVSADIDLDRRLCKETTCLEQEYKLPDNTIIKIGRERFEAAEILFNPCMGGHEFLGVSDIVFDTINKAPMDTRKSLYDSIMISGGTSMFPGFSTRLLNDVTKRYRAEILKGNKDAEMKIKIDVIDPPRRKYNVFIGGGVLATAMANRSDYWITSKDYKEYGTNVVRKIGESLAM